MISIYFVLKKKKSEIIVIQRFQQKISISHSIIMSSHLSKRDSWSIYFDSIFVKNSIMLDQSGFFFFFFYHNFFIRIIELVRDSCFSSIVKCDFQNPLVTFADLSDGGEGCAFLSFCTYSWVFHLFKKRGYEKTGIPGTSVIHPWPMRAWYKSKKAKLTVSDFLTDVTFLLFSSFLFFSFSFFFSKGKIIQIEIIFQRWVKVEIEHFYGGIFRV